MKAPILPLVLVACGLLTAGVTHAERTDRDKPVKLEADRVNVDDIKRVHVFEGNVVLSQGTLSIRTAKLVVTQDAEGFQKGVASGGADGLVRFRQKREGRDDFVEGEAERLEFDARNDRAEFFNRAHLKSGVDEVRGHVISYDGQSEKYSVTGTPSAAGNPSATPGRVTAVIQPKSVRDAPAAVNPPVGTR